MAQERIAQIAKVDPGRARRLSETVYGTRYPVIPAQERARLEYVRSVTKRKGV